MNTHRNRSWDKFLQTVNPDTSLRTTPALHV
ncbi:hypothetical protein chiPu_0027204, partial [Chiloscyllium punctatum]|nr:hypothetical protein [Chiloscyllium punctatum]